MSNVPRNARRPPEDNSGGTLDNVLVERTATQRVTAPSRDSTQIINTKWQLSYHNNAIALLARLSMLRPTP